MLEEMSIMDLGVIHRAALSFDSGLTVITGETGAGKTMLLTGLSLLRGGKADSDIIRSGAQQAAVEGRWQVAHKATVMDLVDGAGGLVEEDGTVLAARTVTASRSRAHVGGRTVPAAILADICTDLITVHGQSDQIRLRTSAKQRSALDNFAGPDHLALLEEYRASWTQVAGLRDQIADLTARSVDRAREADLLRHGLELIDQAQPQPDEDVHVAALVARLSNVETLRNSTAQALLALYGDDGDGQGIPGGLGLIDQARKHLTQAASEDPELASLQARLEEAALLAADAASDIAHYDSSLDADPAQLEQAHARLALLNNLSKRYGQLTEFAGLPHGGPVDGPGSHSSDHGANYSNSQSIGHRHGSDHRHIEAGTTNAVLAWAAQAGHRLMDLDDDSGRIASLTSQVHHLQAQLDTMAQQLTSNRQQAASTMSQAVTDELHGLAMGAASMHIDIDTAEPGPTGADAVTFSLVAHPGAPARPLSKGASGGELSRVMLAIEVALAAQASPAHTSSAQASPSQASLPTFVFDEVDAGVGGKAAVEVGRRLAQLACSTQVIVVTHLAQVAAYADAHILVSKTSSPSSTETTVASVTGQDRLAELARMLSGSQDSATALAHAAELMDTATLAKGAMR